MICVPVELNIQLKLAFLLGGILRQDHARILEKLNFLKIKFYDRLTSVTSRDKNRLLGEIPHAKPFQKASDHIIQYPD